MLNPSHWGTNKLFEESEESCVAEDLLLEFATKFTSKEFRQLQNWDF
jgi:hypothetical protein